MKKIEKYSITNKSKNESLFLFGCLFPLAFFIISLNESITNKILCISSIINSIGFFNLMYYNYKKDKSLQITQNI